jgi:hypothetical protein
MPRSLQVCSVLLVRMISRWVVSLTPFTRLVSSMGSIIMANHASIIMPKNTIYYSYQLVIVTPVVTWRLPHGLEYTGVQALAPLPPKTKKNG